MEDNNVQYVTAEPNPYDHTAEFTVEDVKDNKVFVLVAYLSGIIGIIIALLAAKESPFTKFHIKQILRFTLVEIAAGIVALALCWTFIVPIAAAGFIGFLGVLEIICVIQVCQGKSVEPILIRKLNFLK